MLDILSEPEAKAVLGIAGVLIFVAIAVYVVKAVRGEALREFPHQEDYLSGFREMYEQGALDEAEFRKVRAELSQSLREKIRRDEIRRDKIQSEDTEATDKQAGQLLDSPAIRQALLDRPIGESRPDRRTPSMDPDAPATGDPDERDETK